MSKKVDRTRHAITVLGDGGCGKTAVTIMFTSDHFVEYYDPTIESSYKRQIVVDNAAVLLEILDTAGQDEFTAMQSQWISFGEAFVLIYDITKRISYERIPHIYRRITMVKDCDQSKPPPVVLLGNKTDLAEHREVSTAEGMQLAKQINAIFFETSALNNTNITEAFVELTRAIRKHYGIVTTGGSTENPAGGEPQTTKKIKKSLCTLL